MLRKAKTRRLGVIGGLGALGGADIFFKLIKAAPARGGRDQSDIVFEQHPFADDDVPGDEASSANARKLYVYDMIRQFEERGVEAVVLPCFISHTFLDELLPEIGLPVVNLMEALRAHVERRYPEARTLGVLTSDYVRRHDLFGRYFGPPWRLVYPTAEVQTACLMPAIYGERGIKSGHLQGHSVELLDCACRDLVAQGADLILPGFTEIPIVIDTLRERGLPVVDVNQVYASHAAAFDGEGVARPFKIGVVGGVGPAATVDFVGKIVRHTPAQRDQDHIKLIVEQNPQIPDRTEHLIGDGADPTIALYATCKKLEAEDADLIAIPCNTAHAFVERIQPYLSIPIVNMLQETVAYIRRAFKDCRKVGLLATRGTLESRVYHGFIEAAGLEAMAPDEAHQALVMEAIYGERGVKAGFADEACRAGLVEALAHLAGHGAEVVLLGCTELPLLLAQNEAFAVAGRQVALLDPTDILARRCVELALPR